MPSFGSLEATTVASSLLLAIGGDDGAVGLAGDLAGF